MKILKYFGATLTAALLLAGCGGGGGNSLTQSNGGGGGGGTGATPASIIVTSNQSALLADGTVTATITVLAKDANSVVVPNAAVTVTASSGALVVPSTKTDSSGQITATLSIGGDPTLRTITVTAKSGTLTSTVDVQVIAKGSSSPVAFLTVVSDTNSILSDGSNSANITAYTRDASNSLIPGVPVTFTASSGGIASTSPVTDATGAAKAVLSTAGDPAIRTITVTAKVNALTATVQVQVVASSTTTNTVQLGSGLGASFVAGTIAVSSTSLAAAGSTSLQFVLQNSDGTLYTQPTIINLSSVCSASGNATLPSSVITSTGVATATYTAKGCSPSDTITATASVGTRSLSATSPLINIAAPTIGSISFVSAAPAVIALQGVSSSAAPDHATVTFQVVDKSGGPVQNASVTFALNTSAGGLKLLNTTATSGPDGTIQTIVQSGTVATPVRVTASTVVNGTTISTQSSALNVSTGIPAQNSFSLAVACQNVEAWSIDGVQVDVTARLADRFTNPVPDGTPVQFHTEGGSIASNCKTATVNGNSLCDVMWTSQNPRPIAHGGGDRAGRSSLLAYSIGEESFTDTNGNGVFDAGVDTWYDIPERFEDDNENGVHDSGEFFYDFNNSGSYDPADGIFNGVLCSDPGNLGYCDPNKTSIGIGAQNLIIMSGSSPDNLTPVPGSDLTPLGIGKSALYVFRIADVNDNPMPAGTTVNASITGTGLTLGAPTSYTVPCTTEPTSYGFVVTSAASSGATTGVLTLTISTTGAAGRGGVTTIATYGVTVQ